MSLLPKSEVAYFAFIRCHDFRMCTSDAALYDVITYLPSMQCRRVCMWWLIRSTSMTPSESLLQHGALR